MPKRDRVAEALERLGRAEGAELDRELVAALEGDLSLVAERAATIAAERSKSELVPLLASAFQRFFVLESASDKGCRAKIAIVRALDALEAREHRVFEIAVRHVQREPSYGGPVDTAVPLRAVGAIALVNSRHPRVLLELAQLLADKEHGARAAAAHAIGSLGRREGTPLLLYKARIGDREPEVSSEVLAAIIAIEEDEGVELVVPFLESDDSDARTTAAVALGQSRRESALEPLVRFASRSVREGERKAGLVAIAMLRTPKAFDHLLALVREGSLAIARDAIAALAIYRHDAPLAERLRNAVEERGEKALTAALKEHSK
jgi:HEAT repeat protein